MAVTLEDCCKVIWAWILPPVAVFLETGCSCALLLNILLTILGWLPGVVHAYCVVLHCGEESDRTRDMEEGRAQTTETTEVKKEETAVKVDDGVIKKEETTTTTEVKEAAAEATD